MAAPQGRGMALLFLCLLLASSIACSSAATVYLVGDAARWSLSEFNYNSWAARKSFRVNDALRFAYSASFHNVLQVSEQDYRKCSASRPLAVYTNGNSVVRLSKPGNYFFICGVPGHCEAGMKMRVTVH